MFYCEKCKVKNEWPEGFMKSFGRCECCGKSADCYDVASSRLPLPKTKVTTPKTK